MPCAVRDSGGMIAQIVCRLGGRRTDFGAQLFANRDDIGFEHFGEAHGHLVAKRLRAIICPLMDIVYKYESTRRHRA